MSLWFLKFYDRTGLVEKDGVNLPACSWFGSASESEIESCFEAVEKAEHSGELDGLFKGACRERRELPDKGTFCHSLVSGMKLYKSTFLKIFGHDIDNPGFADEALARLKAEGCSRAEEYYNRIVSEWKEEHDRMLKEVAEWYRKTAAREFENKRKGGEEPREKNKELLLKRDKLRLLKRNEELIEKQLRLLNQK